MHALLTLTNMSPRICSFLSFLALFWGTFLRQLRNYVPGLMAEREACVFRSVWTPMLALEPPAFLNLIKERGSFQIDNGSLNQHWCDKIIIWICFFGSSPVRRIDLNKISDGDWWLVSEKPRWVWNSHRLIGKIKWDMCRQGRKSRDLYVFGISTQYESNRLM